MEVLRGDELADVLDGGDGFAGGVVDGLAAGVDAGEIAGVGDGFGPCQEIGGLIVGEASAFFLIEKEDGVGGKCSRWAAAMALAASRAPRVAGGVPARLAREISASVLPLARTRNPKLLRRRTSRLPTQEFVRSPGGLVSQ